MRRTGFARHLALPLLVVTLAACGGGGGATEPTGGSNNNNGGNTGGTPPGGTPTNAVTVGVGGFSPGNVTVAPNTTVTWTWNSCGSDGYGGKSCVQHSVTFDDTTLGGSATLEEGSYEKAFATKGTYNYHCKVHGTSMSGSVTVQ